MWCRTSRMRTASKMPSANGRRVASAVTVCAPVARRANAALARRKVDAETDRALRRAGGARLPPSPQPISSSRSPGAHKHAPASSRLARRQHRVARLPRVIGSHPQSANTIAAVSRRRGPSTRRINVARFRCDRGLLSHRVVVGRLRPVQVTAPALKMPNSSSAAAPLPSVGRDSRVQRSVAHRAHARSHRRVSERARRALGDRGRRRRLARRDAADRAALHRRSHGDAMVRLVALPQNRGKGAALRAGVAATRGQRVLDHGRRSGDADRGARVAGARARRRRARSRPARARSALRT